jgi:hypothetical protein
MSKNFVISLSVLATILSTHHCCASDDVEENLNRVFPVFPIEFTWDSKAAIAFENDFENSQQQSMQRLYNLFGEENVINGEPTLYQEGKILSTTSSRK